MGGRGKKVPTGGGKEPARHKQQNKREKNRYGSNMYAYLRGITKPRLQLLARRASIKRISNSFYDTARNHMLHNLAEIIRSTISYTACAKRKTIFTKDVVFAANRLGQKLVGMK